MAISQRCTEIGEKLLYSREMLQFALDMVGHAKRPEDVVSKGLAKDTINQAKALSREAELTGDEAMRLEVSFVSALVDIDNLLYNDAISQILRARRILLDLLFQKVVACECEKRK